MFICGIPVANNNTGKDEYKEIDETDDSN